MTAASNNSAPGVSAAPGVESHRPVDVYLDQNHWIYLARAFHGRAVRSEHRDVVSHLLAKVQVGTCRVPLNWSHLVEHLKNADRESRARLAAVFEVFSRSWFLVAWDTVLPQELTRAVAETFGVAPVPPKPQAIGQGVFFGAGGVARELNAGNWSSEKEAALSGVMQQPGGLFSLLMSPDEQVRGEQIESLAERSLNVAKAAEAMREKRRPASIALWRRAQAAEATYQHQQALGAALAQHNKTFDHFRALGPVGMTEFWTRVPTVNVDAVLSRYRDRQWTRPIQPNDLADLWHLVVATPYCDIVVTERFWRRGLEQCGLDGQYGTRVLSDLAELLEAIP